jgi:phosphoribosylamine---glycine ligase
MKILVVGSGGREHALCWKIKRSSMTEEIYCAPGNAGIAQIARCVPLNAGDFPGLADFVKKKGIDLTVVGPEVPLAAGIVDYFKSRGLEIFGPDKKAANLEASKVFAKDIMKKYGVPTASYNVFSNTADALEFLKGVPIEKKLVVKADGLAAGKGVIICAKRQEAEDAVRQIMADKVFGSAGSEVVIEEFLEGEEVSVQIFLDGSSYSIMAAAQDHKRADDNDEGPNTGGMGAYAPAPLFDSALREKTEKKIIAPLIEGLKKEGIDYRGVLYIGLMVDRGEPWVLEFNCRFGDPETEVVLPLLETDLVEIMLKINAKQLDKIKLNWYNKSAACVVLASGGYPGNFEKGKEILGLEAAVARKDTVVFHAGTSSAGNKTVTSGGRVLVVTSLGPDLRGAVSRAYDAAAKISFDKMHYRKDIAQKAFK